jgi:hypothetical protein
VLSTVTDALAAAHDTDTEREGFIPTRLSDTALRAALVSPLPTTGSYTYNPDGTIASDPDGNTYTWNTDGTPGRRPRAASPAPTPGTPTAPLRA